MRLSRLARTIASAAGAVAALAATNPAHAQGTSVIRGTVVDSTDQRPVVNAQIALVGTTLGTMSNAEGAFVIARVPAGSVDLRVQRIGYQPTTTSITLGAGDTAVVRIAMEPSAVQLSAVVAVGYGEESRRNVSAAVATVSNEEIENTPIAGVDAALQGKAAGVQIIQNAGNPGNGITVRIRGAASISANNQPLWVVDGIPLQRDNYSQLGIGGQDITGVTGLNPDEIESITVLKDAAAAAIYGSRGSNGVVMVTTKRGRAGSPLMTFSAYTGTQDVPRSTRWDMLSGREYIEYMNEAAENDGYGPEYFGDPNDPALDETDWQEEIMRSAPVSDLSLGLSGGTDRIQYYMSGSYFDQDGVIMGSAYDRASGRVNLDFQASSRLSIRSSVNIGREEHHRIVGDDTIEGAVTNAIANQPYIPVRNDDGTYTSTDDGLEYVNSVALADYNFIETRSTRALGNVEARYNLTSALALNARAGLDVISLRDLDWDSPRVIGTYCSDVAGCAQHGTTSSDRYVLESFATYDRPTGIATSLALTAGTSVEWNDKETNFIRGEGFSSEEFQYPGNAARNTEYDADWTGHNLASFFGRANATFLDRYLLTTSVRVDGSSRFGENNKWGVFPAASLGWNVTDEAFATTLADYADLKLRASYGLTGNQDIFDDFAPLARFGRANYGDISGIAQTSFANPDLRWESTREYDLGFDLSLLERRLTIIGDWYEKTTFDLLLNRPITSTSGQTTIFENVGNMKNTGVELNVSTINLQGGERSLGWTTDLNISWNDNEVTRLFRNEPFNTGGYDANRVAVGLPLGAFHALRFTGVDPATGDAMYDDVNGDGSITSDDRVIVGSPHPDSWGGMTNTLTWGGFDLRSFLQYAQGQTIFNAISVFADDAGYYYDNKFRRVLDRWQQPGDITDQPRASFDGTSNAVGLISSRYFEDGSYVRLQEVTLGYRLPEQLLGNVRMREGRIYVSGRNLATWTDYSGYNPDVNSSGSSANVSLGLEFYAYPLARTFTIGFSGTW